MCPYIQAKQWSLILEVVREAWLCKLYTCDRIIQNIPEILKNLVENSKNILNCCPLDRYVPLFAWIGMFISLFGFTPLLFTKSIAWHFSRNIFITKRRNTYHFAYGCSGIANTAMYPLTTTRKPPKMF